MPLRVLGVSSSPRSPSNSDLLLREALRGARAGGAEAEYVSLRDLRVGPCLECYACAKTGLCRIQDDFQRIFDRLLEADRLIFATPVFFMAVAAQGKLLIDRCQCLWSRKYLLRQPLFPAGPRDRRAMVIAVGGSRSRKMFECVGLTMKYWFDALDMAHVASLFVNQVDQAGDVASSVCAMEGAYRLGESLASASGAPPPVPVTVECFGPPVGSPPAEPDGSR